MSELSRPRVCQARDCLSARLPRNLHLLRMNYPRMKALDGTVQSARQSTACNAGHPLPTPILPHVEGWHAQELYQASSFIESSVCRIPSYHSPSLIASVSILQIHGLVGCQEHTHTLGIEFRESAASTSFLACITALTWSQCLVRTLAGLRNLGRHVRR